MSTSDLAAIQRRKRVQARLTTGGALIGLGALGARGAQGVALRRGEQGARVARRLESLTTNALTVGAGVGGVAGLNSAAISRAEGRQPVRKSQGVSAFGVEHQLIEKSEYRDGKFKPITAMNPLQRAQMRSRLRSRGALPPSRMGAATEELRQNYRGNKSKIAESMRVGMGGSSSRARDLHAVYQQHGIRGSIQRAVTDRTRPSAVHRNIHYGETMSRERAAQIDRHLDPKLVGKLRHPVVFHSYENAGAYAAAVGPHVTTGHRGHIAVGMEVHGMPPEKARHVINHELVHASISGRPARFRRSLAGAAGEEARADRLAGGQHYHPAMFQANPAPIMRGRQRNFVRTADTLHARGVGSPQGHWGYHSSGPGRAFFEAGVKTRRLTRLSYLGPRKLTVIGAVGAGTALHHNRAGVSKSAFGVEH